MQNRLQIFERKKYTSFRSIRMVALQSVKRNYPESYDFAAIYTIGIKSPRIPFLIFTWNSRDLLDWLRQYKNGLVGCQMSNIELLFQWLNMQFKKKEENSYHKLIKILSCTKYIELPTSKRHTWWGKSGNFLCSEIPKLLTHSLNVFEWPIFFCTLKYRLLPSLRLTNGKVLPLIRNNGRVALKHLSMMQTVVNW
jgi:hypothetical protein